MAITVWLLRSCLRAFGLMWYILVFQEKSTAFEADIIY